MVFKPPSLLWAGGFFLPVNTEKAAVMEVKLYVGNLPESTTGKDLDSLFAQAGDVTAVDVITDSQNGGCRGYAFVTMSALSEADRAVSMFNTYAVDDHRLKVSLVKPRVQRRFATAY